MTKFYNYLGAIILISVAGILTFATTLYSGKTNKKLLSEKNKLIPPIEEHLEYAYGLRVDTFKMFEGTVAKNEFVSDILHRYKVDNQTIHALAINSGDVFDFKKFRAGNNYTILTSNKEGDSLGQYMIYEKNPIEYVVYNLDNPEDIELKKRPTKRVERTLTGSIESSLWQTLVDQETDPELAVNLAQVYQWTIDFSRIQKGDQFNVVYDEVYVNNKLYRTDSIKAAYFNHSGKEFYAFYFKQDSTKQGGFYDESGESVKRAFLQAPVKYTRISSRYTKRRFHPVQKRYKAHLGTDYAAAYNTPIVATGDGTVEAASYTRGNGNYVKIKHPNGIKTQYLHMTKRAAGMAPGKVVAQGDVIGYVGSTGLATGPHVCYRFWKNGKQVDHLLLDLPPGDPIDEQYIEAFEQAKQEYLEKLDVTTPQSIGQPNAPVTLTSVQ